MFMIAGGIVLAYLALYGIGVLLDDTGSARYYARSASTARPPNRIVKRLLVVCFVLWLAAVAVAVLR